ncbi:hypothetical protein [Oceanirhabdus sp. W0125-5]|uniref:hypothetical protein n=1 Tax=Oceanirhabdus sp. W0125-5 TaxID=2999116 RepID=UPI0022F33B6E|nr:hypothetical protein [Oceanirhabdus sp. W0125-5]WBW95119.1 hypothetical protein OW730_15650 [Oceanirhabdus sp. W0125-5]
MKKCIFSSAKECNECGNCNICDLNSEKKCDNCAKCMELQGIDTKAIGFEDIQSEEVKAASKKASLLNLDSMLNDESEEVNTELWDDSTEDSKDELEAAVSVDTSEFSLEDYNPNETFEMDENVVYLDDVEGLSEIMNDPEMKDRLLNENYPGLLKYNEN